MKISEHFKLGKSQPELDFVDVDPTKDKQLFLDSLFLSNRKDPWSIEATRHIQDFFQTVINLLRKKNVNDARRLFQFLHEPNETCLGMSKSKPSGRGVGKQNSDDLFISISKSKAVFSGRISDLEDCHIFVPNFGRDKLSDLITNVIRRLLIDYTQGQCLLHGIPLRPSTSSGWYWDIDTGSWQTGHTEMLVIGGKKILLVPKGVVSYCNDYTPDDYYGHFVLDFLKNEQLQLNTALVRRIPTKKGVTVKVFKKDLRAAFPPSKEFLLDFSEKNAQVFNAYKAAAKSKPSRALRDDTLMGDDYSVKLINEMIDGMVGCLQTLPKGTTTANDFHKAIIGILEFLFYPALINPRGEYEIHDGRKRIDITFDNSMEHPLFAKLKDRFQLAAPYVMVECKNYSSDPKNPELDQLAGRFSPQRGQFGILVCRDIEKMEQFLKRCIDTYKDGRGLMIPLTDNDLIDALEGLRIEQNSIFRIIEDRIRLVTLS